MWSLVEAQLVGPSQGKKEVTMGTGKRRIGIIPQVALVFAIGVLLTGQLTFLFQSWLSRFHTIQQTEEFASEITDEVRRAVEEFPAHDWLLRYWYEHYDELSIDYDTDFILGGRTKELCGLFSRRHPEIQLHYATSRELEALPPNDQKLYAEITYSWLITHLNEIKRSYNIEFLYCVVTDETFGTQFFLFSAADEGAVRGTHYEEVYTLGVTVEVSESLEDAMRSAWQNDAYLADAGAYMDYYARLDSIDGHPVLLGLTYSLADMKADAAAQTATESTLAMALQVALSLLCLTFIFLLVLRPLREVQQNIRLYTETKDSHTVVQNLSKIRSRNEIGQLSEDVAGLAEEIDDFLIQIETIAGERERIATELTLANRIQSDMLPNVFPAFPDREDFDIYASMDPAKDVGGDFYDYFLVDDDHLCLVMADVSGKGIPAALFMMASKIIFANNAMMGKSPAEVLRDANAAICKNNRADMFVTAWIGILELSTGKLTAANAGHLYPALAHPGGSFELVKDKHGLFVGVMAGIGYKNYELQLEPGSRLFLYTDGLPEATDAEEKLLGNDRMLTALNSVPDANPRELLENVTQAVADFIGDAEQFDDLTMMCLSYVGPREDAS